MIIRKKVVLKVYKVVFFEIVFIRDWGEGRNNCSNKGVILRKFFDNGNILCFDCISINILDKMLYYSGMRYFYWRKMYKWSRVFFCLYFRVMV